jgi:hypothetical protein
MNRKKWIKIGKAIGLGVLFGLIAYLISGDGSTSTLLGMLIIYLENKI